jgi:hypothetical protein
MRTTNPVRKRGAILIDVQVADVAIHKAGHVFSVIKYYPG